MARPSRWRGSAIITWNNFPGARTLEIIARSAIELARRALQASPEDPTTLGNVAFLSGVFEGAIEPAITLVDRALALNPSFEHRIGDNAAPKTVSESISGKRLATREGEEKFLSWQRV